MNLKLRAMSDLAKSFYRLNYKISKATTISSYLLGKIVHSTALRKFQSRRPMHAGILLTLRCTRKCPGCIFDNIVRLGEQKADLEMGTLDKILSNPLFSSVCRVALIGGEPLMHKELLEIIQTLRRKGLLVNITTNADILRPEHGGLLRKAGLNWLNISLYNDNRERIRHFFEQGGADSFSKDRISLHYHGEDIEGYEDAYNFATATGFKHLVFEHTFHLKEQRSNDHRDAFAQEFHNFCQSIPKRGELSLYPYPAFNSKELKGNKHLGCGMATNHIIIDPNLNLSPCCLLSPDGSWGTLDSPQKALHFREVVVSKTPPPEVCKQCYMLGRDNY